MRDLTVKTVKGTDVQLTIEYDTKVITNKFTSDWDEEFILSKSVSSKEITKVNILNTEISFEAQAHYDRNYCGLPNELKNTTEAFGFIAGVANNKNIYISLDEAEYSRFLEAVNAEKENSYSDEARQIIENQNRKLLENNISWAKEIMKNVEAWRTNGCLMNNLEAKAWKYNYNQTVNEGGEGYVPNPITQEDFDWAESIMGEIETDDMDWDSEI